MMLHALHYDVAFYVPGNKWHPGVQKHHFLFTAMTPRGQEQLECAPYGEYKNGHLIITCESEATDVMDHVDTLEVYLSH